MLYKKFVYMILIIMLFVFNAALGQKKVFFEHLSVPNGLSSNSIRGICQDQYGYLWIATSDGLNRYDGYKFEVFKNDPADSMSLPASSISTVYRDHEGNIWVGTPAGLTKRDPISGKFISYLPDPESGLSNDQWVISIFEDSKDRLWIGMRFYGARMFDRKTGKFSDLKIANGDSTTAFGGPVHSFLETATGDIFVGTYRDGLLRYNEQRGALDRVDPGERFRSIIKSHFIWNIHEDKTGQLWLTTTQPAVFKYDPQRNVMQKIDLASTGTKASKFTTINEDSEGNLWFGSDAGIFRYNLRSGSVDRFRKDNSDPHSLNHQDIWCSYEDDFGVIWFGTGGGGLNKYDPRKIPFTSYLEFAPEQEIANTNAVYSIAPVHNKPDAYWLGTGKGLLQFDRRQNKVSQLPLPGTASDNIIRALDIDEKGILWIATDREGLLKYDIKNNSFSSIKADYYTFKGLRHNRVYTLERDDYGNMWVGTQNGLSRLNPQNGNITHVPGVEPRNYSPVIHSIIDSVSHHNRVLAEIKEVGDYGDITREFEVGEQTSVLIHSLGEGLVGWNMLDYGWLENAAGDTLYGMTDIYQTFHHSGGTKNRVQVKLLNLKPGKYVLRYSADDSHAWGAWNDAAPSDSTAWGIQVYQISETARVKYDQLIAKELARPYINGLQIYSLCYSRRGYLWVGTDFGLSRYDPKSRQIINYVHNGSDPNSLSNDHIQSVFEDREGILWIATVSGLNKFDPNTEKFTVYHEKDGLPSGQLRAIVEDQEGNLWISGLNGITKFEKNRLDDGPRFINYDVQDGLQGYEFFWRSVWQTEKREMIFGGRNGFTAFFPGMINHIPPRIVISNFTISNEPIYPGDDDSPLENPLMETNEVYLSYDQNDLSFEFAALHFGRPLKNQIHYRLDGFQNEWINEPRRLTSFTNLDPGMYMFRLKGMSGDGIQSANEHVLKITINPPWWSTTLAYIMYSVLLLASIFAADRIQRYRLTTRERNRSQLREAELRAQVAESENERKTYELEEARRLQLSLLPEKLPELPNLEIAVYMKTATEVGGDYYDFNISADGTLNIALGDATGHGMQAGTVVTLMKGLFSADSGRMDIPAFFQQSSETIKDLRFGRMMMAFTMIKIKDNNMLFSTAGMPPAYIYRPAKLKVDELCLEGMPLGAMKEFNYQVINETLAQGDTILLLSDGLPELKNPAGEQFDYLRVQEIFRDIADQPPQAIIDRMVDAGEMWRKDQQPDDDITLMVIKTK